jgi:electron transfer flavoprotein alpha subunit
MAGILVVAEHVHGKLADITFELIGAAGLIKEGLGGPVMVAVVGAGDTSFAEQVNVPGVDEIFAVDVGSDHFDPAVYEEVVCQLGGEHRPRAILVGHTISAMGYAAAIAARLGSGFASDVFAIDVEGGDLIVTRSAYGNKVNLELGFPNKAVVVLTLRGATFAASKGAGAAQVRHVAVDTSKLDGLTTHLNYEEVPPSEVDISKAEFIVSVGRGIKDKDNLPRFVQLAERLGATLGCSRPIVDSGWLPKSHQVGQSGTVASSCKLYLALGISGAIQHQFGMKHVDTIIAINTDPDAPIFNVATYGAVVDVFELADALERQSN